MRRQRPYPAHALGVQRQGSRVGKGNNRESVTRRHRVVTPVHLPITTKCLWERYAKDARCNMTIQRMAAVFLLVMTLGCNRQSKLDDSLKIAELAMNEIVHDFTQPIPLHSEIYSATDSIDVDTTTRYFTPDTPLLVIERVLLPITATQFVSVDTLFNLNLNGSAPMREIVDFVPAALNTSVLLSDRKNRDVLRLRFSPIEICNDSNYVIYVEYGTGRNKSYNDGYLFLFQYDEGSYHMKSKILRSL